MGNHLSDDLAMRVIKDIEESVNTFDGSATDFYRQYYDKESRVRTVMIQVKSIKRGGVKMGSRMFFHLSRLVSDKDLIGQCAYYLARHDDMTMDFDLQAFLVEQAMKYKKRHGIKRGGGTPVSAMYYLEKKEHDMTKLEVGKKYWIKAKFLGELTESPFGPFIPGKRYAFRIGELKTPTSIDFSVEDFEALEASPEREKVTIPKEVADWIEDRKYRGRDTASGAVGLLYDHIRSGEKVDEEMAFYIFNNIEKVIDAYNHGYTLKQPLGVLLVDMPENAYWKYMYLYVDVDGGYDILGADKIGDIIDNVETVKVTEAEAKEKYPNFKWVSLEELEDEV